MYKSLLLLFISISFLSGCSSFGGDKDVRKKVANGLTPKELYEIAEDKVNAGSIDQAIEQFEVIMMSYPSSKYAIQARLDKAYNLFKRRKYNRAIQELDKFIEKHPSISSTPYAYYLRGVIAEEKSSSILDNIVTDISQRDIQGIKDAYNYYVILIDKYPNSKYSEDATERLESLKNVLAKHELYIAIYYTNNNSHIAAINRSKYIIENYPSSQAMGDSIHLMAYNYDAINAKKLADDARFILKSTYSDYSPSYKLD